MTSRHLSTGVDSTVHNMSNEVHGTEKVEDVEDASRGGAASLRKRQCLKKEKTYVVRDEFCLLLKEVLAAITNPGRIFSADNLYLRMLEKVLGDKALRSFAVCVRERISVDSRHVLERDVCERFVDSGPISRDYCVDLIEYNLASTEPRLRKLKNGCCLGEGCAAIKILFLR